MFAATCLIVLNVVAGVQCHSNMEGYIVGGQFANIYKYPHMAMLSVTCNVEGKPDGEQSSWICGSSILNQDLVLTAAHCLYSCKPKTVIVIQAGSAIKNKGYQSLAFSYIIHENYNDTNTTNDIAMIRAKTKFQFSPTISRVAVFRRPPKTKFADLAGWGMTNEVKHTLTKKLKHLDQVVWKVGQCEQYYGRIPEGSFCASSNSDKEYVSSGDSGSALTIYGFIQIGLVSYKVPHISSNLIVYTNVSYYYDWIKHNGKRLYCNGPNVLRNGTRTSKCQSKHLKQII